MRMFCCYLARKLEKVPSKLISKSPSPSGRKMRSIKKQHSLPTRKVLRSKRRKRKMMKKNQQTKNKVSGKGLRRTMMSFLATFAKTKGPKLDKSSP